jgi:hypothetical protein
MFTTAARKRLPVNCTGIVAVSVFTSMRKNSDEALCAVPIQITYNGWVWHTIPKKLWSGKP